jgi:hypothetical protein
MESRKKSNWSTTVVFFDSRYRDYTLYPTPDRFLITLLRPISEVFRIRLVNSMVRDVPFGTHWLFGVSIDKYGQGITRTEFSPEYPQALLGIFSRNEPVHAVDWKLYRDTDDESACLASFPGRIPRLQEFEISIRCADESGGTMAMVPAPIYDPADPDPDMTLPRKNWYGTLAIDHY